MLQLEIENLKTTINLCSFCIKSMNKLLSRKRSVIEAIDEVDKPMIDRMILRLKNQIVMILCNLGNLRY